MRIAYALALKEGCSPRAVSVSRGKSEPSKGPASCSLRAMKGAFLLWSLLALRGLGSTSACSTVGYGLNDDSACELCGWGKFSISRTCTVCPTGKYRNYGPCSYSEQVACYAARYPDLVPGLGTNDADSLTEADETTMWNHWNGNGFAEGRFMGCDAGTHAYCGDTCTSCSPGKYQGSTGKTSCVWCPAGKTSQETGVHITCV